jgi:hypothetical protein
MGAVPLLELVEGIRELARLLAQLLQVDVAREVQVGQRLAAAFDGGEAALEFEAQLAQVLAAERFRAGGEMDRIERPKAPGRPSCPSRPSGQAWK